MAKLKNGWVKKIIDGVSEKIFAISHVKSTYYNYTEGKLLSDKLDEIDKSIDTIEKSNKSTNTNIPESFRFYNCVTKKNADGSILETYDFGTLLTTKNEDGSYTEVFTDNDGNSTTKTTVVSEDGTVTETVVSE